MIGVWNRSLTARFVAVMLLALALSQGISFLLFTDEIGGALVRAAKTEFLSRTASVAQVLETTPPAVQHDILQASGTSYTRFWVSPSFPGDVESWRGEAKRRLAEPLPTLANLAGTEQVSRETAADASMPAPQTVSVTVMSPAATNGAAAASSWIDLPAHAWPLSRAAKFLYWNDAGGMGLAVQLKDGSWLNSAFSKKMVNSMLTTRSLISLAVTAVILSLCAAFIARTMTKPMRRLAAAAEALGRGESVAPLSEKGPDDIRHTAVAFNLMQSRLQRFVEDRTRMLAAIGHDLRTPITSLRLRAEFVSDDETREKMLDTLDELRAMTEATLAFSREQANEEVTRNVDLTALVGSLCDDLVELGNEIYCAEGQQISYRCRPDALKRAIRNLVENAVRYGERARVSLRTTPQAIEIVIEDDGPGIPADAVEKVFEPFFRMEHSRNRETGGIGLGLSISRNMVRHHGGDILLANTGHGLRATISLPHAATPTPEAKGTARSFRRAGRSIIAVQRTPAE
ncbi:sensor histidine kinase [Ancylobacter radicis]|uniref:histidine kinase n=1 Tax=Ancylobacter radicis TaxID=2836179 RepID=A0ABS5R9Y3_9HYPH|nr:HAMP domain-containing sensor histidine kinase [Ancylobacter radicis]MBS9478480.1 HAMP domain-containing histidine kinase [Ancylobacter radicis]